MKKKTTFTKDQLMKLVYEIKTKDLKLLYDNKIRLNNELFMHLHKDSDLIQRISLFIITEQIEPTDDVLIVLHDPQKKLYGIMTRDDYILTENTHEGLKRIKRFLLQQNIREEYECGVCYDKTSTIECVVQQCYECFNYVCDSCRIKMINDNKYECPFCRATVDVTSVFQVVYEKSDDGSVHSTKHKYSIDSAKAFIQARERIPNSSASC